MLAIEKLVVKMANEHAMWGLERIQGALAALGHTVARSTIANVLERNGIAPSPDLRTSLMLFAIRYASRKVEILGVKDTVSEEFSRNVASNLVDPDAAGMSGVTHLIIDRDTKFTPEFKTGVERAGVKIALTPARSPDCSAIAERFVGTLRRELLRRMVFFGEHRLRRARLGGILRYYHRAAA